MKVDDQRCFNVDSTLMCLLGCDEVYHVMGIRQGNSTHTMGNGMSSNFPFLLIQWALLHFPVLWEIDGKTHAFPI